MTDQSLEHQLREEFNRWAEAGRGDAMEQQHLPIVEPVLALLEFSIHDRVLDVGCGTGWLVRRIAPLVSAGLTAGMDVSDAMLERAEALRAQLANVVFARGGVGAIPWDSSFFTKVLSVESAYYWPDPAKGLREIFRVLSPGGSAWILINYYRDNPQLYVCNSPCVSCIGRRGGCCTSPSLRRAGSANTNFPTIRSVAMLACRNNDCCTLKSVPKARSSALPSVPPPSGESSKSLLPHAK